MATVLVIDDDQRFRDLVSVALRPAGHRVLEAGRARDAEAILARGGVELILIDGLLPDADGARWIGERRKALGAPFIFVSAFWKGGRDGRQLQADVKPADFLRKPATAAQILQAVQRALGGASTPNGLSAADLAELEAMRIDYTANVPARLAAIRQGLAQVRSRARDTVLFAETRRQVHEVAGTAGSFGMEALSEICANMEQALMAWRARCDDLGWAGVAAWERALLRWEQNRRQNEPLVGSQGRVRQSAVGANPI